MMRLSHSVRVAERAEFKREASSSLDLLARAAAAAGCHALCMRASQLGVDTPLALVAEGRRLLHGLGLKVSMVTGDFPIPENTEDAPDALRNITPYLDLAEALGSDLIRIGMKREEDVQWAQRSADEADERGVRLAHQCHTQSLFERVDESIRVLKLVARRNFGITYEPANLELCGEGYGPETIKALSPYIFNVYLQNQVVRPDGRSRLLTWSRGEVSYDQIPIWEGGGVDFPLVLGALEDMDYDGYVTIHQAALGPDPTEAIRAGAGYLRSVLGFETDSVQLPGCL